MDISVRKAGTLDAREMAELLNEIIEIGGTTALTDNVTKDDMIDWMSQNDGQNSWLVAQNETGKLMGFQFLEPNPKLPIDAVDIATFVRVGAVQLGIGSKLFDGTRAAATTQGYAWINATIKAENSGGLAYYGSRGFETYHIDYGAAVLNSSEPEKVHKRFDLR